MARTIVGLGGLLDDPACCVVHNGSLASAVEQSKVARHHRSGSFPAEAFAAAVDIAGIDSAKIDCVAVARPFAVGPESLTQVELRSRFPAAEIVVVEHHNAHAASAFYASPFEEASVLSVDRAGDYRSAVLFQGANEQLTPLRELYFPDSLGDLYNRVTKLLGFEARADEHKVQWLSAAGRPVYLSLFQEILHQGAASWPHIDLSFFDADRLSYGGFSARFYEAIGSNAHEKVSAEQRADLAASLQIAIEEAVVAMLGSAQNVCLAGGLALNATLTYALEQAFGRVFVQPVAGNAGTALGAALHAWHNFCHEKARIPFHTLALGPSYNAAEIKQVVENCKLRFRFLPTEGELIERAIAALNDNQIVAWMHGRMEFGPRALGHRSILASPLNPYSSENLNAYIKHRESFRKFAASVPAELAENYFRVGANARYLATVGQVLPEHKETFAAAILARDLIRIHTVHRDENPLYHALLIAAGKSTGLPVLYNTSFNLFGDPLVCTPRDAVRSFYSSGIDALFAGNFLLEK
ncbi:MAG: carbamoyltransferase C-terminal domain-containing protein [Bryobacteraceae bacterium]